MEHKYFNQIKKTNDEGVVKFIASTETKDSHGDVVKQQGWEFADNVPLLYEHDDEKFPIGKVIEHRVVNDELVATAQIDLDDEMGKKVWRKMKDGFLSQFSVGFEPIESEPLEDGRAKFKRQILREISVVSVGSNRDTKILHLKSVYSRDELKNAMEVIKNILQKNMFDSKQDLVDETMKYFADNSDVTEEELKSAYEEFNIESPFETDKKIDEWRKSMFEKNVKQELEDLMDVDTLVELYPELEEEEIERLMELREEMIDAMDQAAQGVLSNYTKEEKSFNVHFPEGSDWEDYTWE